MECPKCGKDIKDDSKFCMECGEKIDAGTASSLNSTKDKKDSNVAKANSKDNAIEQKSNNDEKQGKQAGEKKQKSGITKMGVASIVLGGCGFLFTIAGVNDSGTLAVAFVTSILAVIFGSIGLHSVLKKKRKSKPVAITGFVIAVVSLVLSFSCYCAATSGSDSSKSSTQKQTTTQSQNNTNSENKQESVPTEYKNAQKKAQNYSDSMYMSKQGIYDQLTSEYGEKFSAEAANYALEHITADYNKNALKKAEGYYKNMSMSKQSVYDQLTSAYGEKFTASEAQYAIDNLK